MKGLTILLLVLPAVLPVYSESVFDGRDFMTGSGAVDASRYLDGFFEAQEGKKPLSADMGPLGFGLISRWTPATFLVRDTDVNGRPLVGPSAGGRINGSLMAYRAALNWKINPYFGTFFAGDYFVASHIDSFPRLFDPWYASNDVLSFFGFLFTAGLYGPLTGGRATGFAAVSGQLLPGVSFHYPGWAEVYVGALFKFRDPIDSDGRFISTYYYDKNSWTGVTGKQKPDYLRREDIPPGIGGFETSELYFKAKVLGVDSQTLLTPAGALKALTAGPDLVGLFRRAGLPDPVIRISELIRPFGGFLGEGYDRFRALGGWFGLLKGSFQGDQNFPVYLSYQTDVAFDPVMVNNFQAEAAAFGALGGFSARRKGEGYLYGWKIGLGGSLQSFFWELSWSWNYAGSEIGALEIKDDTVFNLLVRI